MVLVNGGVEDLMKSKDCPPTNMISNERRPRSLACPVSGIKCRNPFGRQWTHFHPRDEGIIPTAAKSNGMLVNNQGIQKRRRQIAARLTRCVAFWLAAVWYAKAYTHCTTVIFIHASSFRSL